MIAFNPFLKIQARMVADGMPRLAVAYSGGLDSRFLCFAASRAGASVLALHCHGPHIPEEETEEAIAFAREARLRLELVQADPEFAAVLKAAPYRHSFEQFFLKPGFLGYYSSLKDFKTKEALEWSTVACLYGKRMPDFLQRCSQFQDSALPKSIAEGLALQAVKQPELLQIFPQLELVVNRLDFFLNDASPYTQDKERGAVELFERYKGFYPYYYYFGNLNNTRKSSEEELGHNNAGVN